MDYSEIQKILIKNDPTLVTLCAATDFSLFTHRSSALYPALVRAIAHQMVHGNAAKACLKRLCAKVNATTGRVLVPSAILIRTLTMADIRACGFSENKSRAIYELTEKQCAGLIPTTRTLKKMSDADIVKLLIPLRGIGRWTVEMYLIFSLGRMDVFPVDDFGVREGYRIWKKEKMQRSPAYLRKKARRWSPYGSIVARACWQMADRAKKTSTKA
jgi:DNA-3-methyladenine glycosylase II